MRRYLLVLILNLQLTASALADITGPNDPLLQQLNNWVASCGKMINHPELTPTPECKRIEAAVEAMKQSYTSHPCIHGHIDPRKSEFELKIRQDFEGFRKTLDAALNRLTAWPPEQVWNLIQCVELNESTWRKACRPRQAAAPNSCTLPGFKTVQVEFNDKCDRTFVYQIGEDLGRGSSKAYWGAFEYRTWTHLARGQRLPAGVLAQWRKEVGIFNEINRLSPRSRVGLIETLYADDFRILQAKYDRSLEDELRAPSFKNDSPWNEIVRFQLLRQITRGLENLQEQGYVHRDFKSANVLVNQPQSVTKAKAVVTDFGSTFKPYDLLSEGGSNLIAGTYDYFAPEQSLFEWVGGSASEKIANSKKADVYSQALVALEMLGLYPRELGHYFKCQSRTQGGRFAYRNYELKKKPEAQFQCQNEWFILTERLKARPGSFGKFLAKSLSIKPSERPTSVEFREMVDGISEAKFGKLVLQQNPDLPIQKNLNDVKTYFGSTAKPTFALTPVPNEETGNLQMALIIKTSWYQKDRVILMEADPSVPGELAAELTRLRAQFKV